MVELILNFMAFNFRNTKGFVCIFDEIKTNDGVRIKIESGIGVGNEVGVGRRSSRANVWPFLGKVIRPWPF